MKMLWHSSVLLLFATTVSALICPTPKVCECVDVVVSCICNNRQTVVLSSFVLMFNVKRVIVHGCGTVILPLGSMPQMDLDIMELIDIEHLVVRPFALSGIDRLTTLVVQDIAELDVRPLGFSGLNNMTKIHFKNVTAHTLSKAAFGQISEVEEFIIDDSVFAHVDVIGFLIGNITSFRVSNCRFNYLQNGSILIHQTSEVTFKNTVFQDTMEDSFVFTYIDSINFNNCTFGKLASRSILSSKIANLAFVNSTLTHVESDALINADVRNSFVMRNNVFDLAEEKFLPNHTNNLKLNIKDNKFKCDCNISWLWKYEDEIYSYTLDTSKCNDKGLKALSSLMPQFSASDKCITIDRNSYLYEDSYQSDKFQIAASSTNCGLFILVILSSIITSIL